MYDKELTCHILTQILNSIGTISTRFQPVNTVDDFTNTAEGMEKFDSICMLLITIGESLKNFDKITQRQVLKRYPSIDWKKIKGLRDIIAHQYFDVNAEAIFDVCSTKIPVLDKVVQTILKDLCK